MRVFDPESPFIKSVEEALRHLGIECFRALREASGERIGASWFPKLKYGLLFHDADNDTWEQWETSEDHDNLLITFHSDGATFIQQGDDDYLYLQTTLRSGDEFRELAEFYTGTKVDKIGSSSQHRRTLDSLLADVYLLVPADPDPGVIALKGIDFATRFPEVTRMLDAFFVSDNPDDIASVGYACVEDLFDAHNLRDSLPVPQALREGDILLNERGELLYAGLFRQDAHSRLGSFPTLVLRPSDNISCMWLSDYLEFASESHGVLKGIVRNWKNIARWLKTVEVALPSTKPNQIATSITRRLFRYCYVNSVHELTTLREPFDNIHTLYRKRLRATIALHTELLDDLEAIQQPLPFFLEYPYHHFRKEDDHVQKIHAGQRLLGMLAKVPLFLVIEELLAQKHPLGDALLFKLEERPPSDGTLVELQRKLDCELAKLSSSPLVMFKTLAEMFNDTSDLEAAVAARNRMHHEPYDEEGFLSIIGDRAPRIIERARMALDGCLFIVPCNCKVLCDEKIVIAENVCSVDSHFRRMDVRVTLPLEDFPSDELLVWQATPERVLRLGRLVTSQIVMRQSRDFGVFDRMQQHKPLFTFMRSGQERAIER